jgi:hypothetical protein
MPSASDRTEIYELYARYSWALDTGDTEGYLDLFTADAQAIEETSSGEIETRQGRDEIRKLVRKFHDRPDFPGHQHQMAQFVFSPDPEQRPRPLGGAILCLGDDQPPAGKAAPALVRPRPRRGRQGRRGVADPIQVDHGLGRRGAGAVRAALIRPKPTVKKTRSTG